MRTIEFNNEDIKECKLALLRQDLTSLQSAFLMQHITNLEQAIEEIKDKLLTYGETFDNNIHQQFQRECLQIIDRVLGDDEVEIIEEDEKPSKIDELPRWTTNYDTSVEHTQQEHCNWVYANKINELTKAVNYLLDKEE